MPHPKPFKSFGDAAKALQKITDKAIQAGTDRDIVGLLLDLVELRIQLELTDLRKKR